MKFAQRLALVAMATLMASSAAFAQKAAGPLESRLVARKVVIEGGRENLVDARDARPGDVIEYVATYRNTGTAVVRDLEATLPIPKDTELVAGSPRPAGARGSLDGQAFAALPLKRKVKRADGREAEEAVPLAEIRALRWSAGELPAGRGLSFTARVRVVDDRLARPEPAAGAAK